MSVIQSSCRDLARCSRRALQRHMLRGESSDGSRDRYAAAIMNPPRRFTSLGGVQCRAQSNRLRNNVREMQVTYVHLPTDLLYVLRMVAIARATNSGGRPSVSDVIRELLESHRKQFNEEAL